VILEDDKYAAFTNWDESDLPPCRLLWVKVMLARERPCS
jgi:hypothetical protein